MEFRFSLVYQAFKYRDRAKIIADILIPLVRNPEGKRRTNIKQSANLSSEMLNRYLDLLIRNGYIMIENKEVYRLTSRGLKLLQNLDMEYLRMAMKT
jgi:predicted transcriptional regulator